MFIIKWLWSNLKGTRAAYLFALLISVATTLMILISPYIVGEIVNVVQNPDSILSDLVKLLLILVVVQLVRTGLRYFMIIIVEVSSQSLQTRIKNHLYDMLQNQDMRYFDTNKTGDIMAKMSGDMDAIRHIVAWVVHNALECVVLFTSAVIYLFTVDWFFTLCLLALSPLIFFFTFKASRKLRPLYTKIRDEFSKLNAVVQENIAGNRVIKAFVRSDFEKKKFKENNDAFTQANLETSNTWLKYFPYIEMAAISLNVIVLLLGGLLFIFKPSFTLAHFTIFSGLVWAISNPLRMMSTIMNDTQRGLAAIDKIMPMYYAQHDIEEIEIPFVKERLNGDIKFDNVSLKIDGKTILHNLSFEANAGETVAIMGPTGAGKTMLINLLPRFYDICEGSITIDGVDVREYEKKSLRKNIALTMQDVFLFSDTVEGNIAFGDPDMPLSEVNKAADIASVTPFIDDLQEGYDTIVGERGVGLSGGQKQRISLARALAVKTPILILDDTTSAVDMETEKYIQHELATLDYKCTKLIIAQRISSVKHADKILIVENGTITESGSHDELLGKNGYYKRIYNLQHSESNTSSELMA